MKITIRDLPLHEVANDEVLQALKEFTDVASPVKHCNIWIDGRQTYLWNSDRFVYILEGNVKDLPPSFSIREMKAWIFKPVAYAKCSCYHHPGHRASSQDCLALAPQEVQDSTVAFKGSNNPLSNLHMCPEGCKWENKAGLEVISSEHEYQYEKLVMHSHADKAERLLEESHAIDVMHSANAVVPPKQENYYLWAERKFEKMETACHSKFDNCLHAQEVLLKSRLELAECTPNLVWGTGLDAHRMVETLPDFWPG